MVEAVPYHATDSSGNIVKTIYVGGLPRDLTGTLRLSPAQSPTLRRIHQIIKEASMQPTPTTATPTMTTAEPTTTRISPERVHQMILAIGRGEPIVVTQPTPVMGGIPAKPEVTVGVPKKTYFPYYLYPDMITKDVPGVREPVALRGAVKPVPEKVIESLTGPATLEMITTGEMKPEKMSVYEFKARYPHIQVPESQFGNYDTVKVQKLISPSTGGVTQQYTFDYSPVSKHKIKFAGSTENYDEFLSIVKSHPELPALYGVSGGTGVGPFGILPSVGIDWLLASDKPGITGASEKEEILMKYLYKVKGGDPKSGPTAEGMFLAVIENPWVQMALANAVIKGAVYITKTGLKVAPKVVAKMPTPIKQGVTKLVTATNKFGGPAGKNIMQTQIGRNITRWATEGAVPVVKTTPRVVASEHVVRKLFTGPRATAYIDDVGNVVMKAAKQAVGYIDDFNRVILYKPKRTLGFLERTFVSPKVAKKYQTLLKRGITKPELDVILRGEMGEHPWAKLQWIAEQTGYKKKWLRGVKHPYRSKTVEISFADYPKSRLGELLTESEAIKRAILTGKVPREYGSLYNIQAMRELGLSPELARQILPEEYLYMRQLPGELTVAAKRLPPDVSMRNIWAKKQWDHILKQWDEAAASLIRQPTRRIISAEEKALVRAMQKGADVYGKGLAYDVTSQFMIPEAPMGYTEFMMYLGMQPFMPIEAQRLKTVLEAKQRLEPVGRAEVYGRREAVGELGFPFVGPETRFDYDRLMLFRSRGRRPRTGTADLTMPIQQQRLAKAMATKVGYPYPFPPELVTERIIKRPPPPPPKKGRVTFPGFPWFPPFWFPRFRGRITDPKYKELQGVQYINEYELLQRLMREVVF